LEKRGKPEEKGARKCNKMCRRADATNRYDRKRKRTEGQKKGRRQGKREDGPKNCTGKKKMKGEGPHDHDKKKRGLQRNREGLKNNNGEEEDIRRFEEDQRAALAGDGRIVSKTEGKRGATKSRRGDWDEEQPGGEGTPLLVS